MHPYSSASFSFWAITSAMDSGQPQPIPPDSSFRFQIKRRMTTLADSGSNTARSEITFPMAVTARHLTSSSRLHKQEKSGPTACLAGSRRISASPFLKLSARRSCSIFFLSWRPPSLSFLKRNDFKTRIPVSGHTRMTQHVLQERQPQGFGFHDRFHSIGACFADAFHQSFVPDPLPELMQRILTLPPSRCSPSGNTLYSHSHRVPDNLPIQ